MVSGLAALVFLRMVVNDHGNLFVAAETVHAIGLYVPIYKLMKENTCAGNTYETSLSASFFFSLYRFMSILHYDLERISSCFL
jgi:prophage antirepressor-like protein